MVRRPWILFHLQMIARNCVLGLVIALAIWELQTQMLMCNETYAWTALLDTKMWMESVLRNIRLDGRRLIEFVKRLPVTETTLRARNGRILYPMEKSTSVAWLMERYGAKFIVTLTPIGMAARSATWALFPD